MKTQQYAEWYRIFKECKNSEKRAYVQGVGREDGEVMVKDEAKMQVWAIMK